MLTPAFFSPARLALAAALLLGRGAARAQDSTFPADGGVIDVTKAPYNAKGDGVTDDTQAILRALADENIANQRRIVYLPKGTYLVSGTLLWPKGLKSGDDYKRTTLQGVNKAGTIIRLKDGAAGFGDAASPKPVVDTQLNAANGFENTISDLTVDVGRRNPGATGIKFNSNNGGGVYNVRIKSSDPAKAGVAGLNLGYPRNGQHLIKNVAVDGFDTGIITGSDKINSVVLESIDVRNQRVCGVYNYFQAVTIRGLRSTNAVPAVRSGGNAMSLHLLDAVITGSGNASTRTAIEIFNTDPDQYGGIRATMQTFLRNIQVTGYQHSAISFNKVRFGVDTLDGNITEYVSHGVYSLFPGNATRSLGLAVRETPAVAWGTPTDTADWVRVRGFTGAAIQAAIDRAGAQTVYLPNGTYTVTQPIIIRGSVRRIIGLRALLQGAASPTFRFENGTAPAVVVQHLNFPSLEHAASRTLVVRNSQMGLYSNTGRGDIYVEEVIGGHWRVSNQRLWARMVNLEDQFSAQTKLVNDGGTVWILGLKTEHPGVAVETTGGGRTEVLGGMIYNNGGAKATPAFINRESTVSLAVSAYGAGNAVYQDLVVETRNGVTDTLRRADVPLRDLAGTLPLYVGGPVGTTTATQSAAPAAATSLAAYPNPSAGHPTVVLTARRAQTAVVEVHNERGKLLGQHRVGLRAGRTECRLPGILPQGIYYLKARIDGENRSFTLQVE
ncbi:glycoside hydrolase family 55 protein [Hymenobacter weizhouensis]|uniref:glycoside hydrolase family 55 protein n=1 Tax=Hymenobacter sp. YIM 151500-1 TaxID=2987689 RepID=UPI0022261934|nr:glycoside hydrolase family 55 protein [Hymenobacter sp. YIM 151500-1]UYZ63632.1 glycoside hydrolase family 55 protein [Hymenobacter sp. YIM 151500-1]